MTEVNLDAAPSTAPPVRKIHFTKNGVEFDPEADEWKFRDGTFDLYIQHSAYSHLNPTLRSSVRSFLTHTLEKKSARTTHAYNRVLIDFLSLADFPPGATEIGLAAYLNARAKPTQRHLGAILQTWYRLGLAGVNAQVYQAILELRGPKGAPKGVPVATADPVKGPFTELEFESLQDAINHAYIDETLDAADFVMCWLSMAFGVRPVQLAALKLKDFLPNGTETHKGPVLMVPRAKRKNVGERQLFKERPLAPQLASIVQPYVDAVRAELAGLLDDPGEAPFFPMRGRSTGFPAGWEYHPSGAVLTKRFTAIGNWLAINSIRTGKRMPTNAYRFRYTFGTRGAAEGIPDMILAEMMDHDNLGSISVYVEACDGIVDRINKAVAGDLAAIANAFRGRIISGPKEASLGEHTAPVIRDLRVSASPLASCAQDTECELRAPIACYTCRSFEPWLNAPHEAVLAALLKLNKKKKAQSHGRQRVHNRTILAVIQVINLCKSKRGDSK